MVPWGWQVSSSVSPRAVLAAWEANSFLQELKEPVAPATVTRSGHHQWELKTGPSTPHPLTPPARPITIVRDASGQHGSCVWVSQLLCRIALPPGTRAELDLCVRESVRLSVFSNSL